MLGVLVELLLIGALELCGGDLLVAHLGERGRAEIEQDVGDAEPCQADQEKAADTQAGTQGIASKNYESSTFYPLTFPITAGPGCLVVMLTLSAHTMERQEIGETVLANVGLMLAVLLLSSLVYVCYGYAPQIAGKISPSTVHGILRVIAFILLCIGVQIAWNGFEALVKPLLKH